MTGGSEMIRLSLKVLAGLAFGLLLLAAWLIWRNPAEIGGYLTAVLAVLQLVVSKIGEAIRVSGGAPVEPGGGS